MNAPIGVRPNGVMRHPQYQVIWDRIQRCHRSVERRGFPENLRFVGVSGVGKSTLLKDYRAAFGPILHSEYTEVPVVYGEVPAMPTGKQLAINLLKGLGCSDLQGTSPQLWERFVLLCRRCGVQLILLDEIQHFVDRGRLSTYSAAADLLKQRLSEVNAPVILAGAPRSRLLFEGNNQVRGRYKACISLHPFDLNNVESFERFRTVIATSTGDFPEGVRRILISDNMVERFFYATDGIFRNLIDLTDGLRVLQDGKRPFGQELISQAFCETIFSKADKTSDPFSPQFGMRRLTNVGEPYMPSAMDGDNHAIY